MRGLLLFLILAAMPVQAQHSLNTKAWVLRLDKVAELPAGAEYVPYEQGELITISWVIADVADSNYAWSANPIITYLDTIPNTASLWVGDSAYYQIPTADKEPGLYHGRLKGLGRGVEVDPNTGLRIETEVSTPFTESFFPLSIVPPQIPGGTSIGDQ